MIRKQSKPRITDIHVISSAQVAVTIFYNFKHLVVSLFQVPQPEGHPIENKLIDILCQAVTAEKEWEQDTFDEYDKYDNGMEKHWELRSKAEKILRHFGKFVFAHSAPPVMTTPNGLNLQDLLYPVVFHLRLQTIKGKVIMSRIVSDQAVFTPEPDTKPKDDPSFEPDPGLLVSSAEDIQVLSVMDSTGVVCRVCVNGQIMLAKAYRDGVSCHRLQTEMNKLAQIGKAERRFEIKLATTEILGYITDAHTGIILGYLAEWIESCPHGTTLDDIDLRKIPFDVRRKWAEQVQEAVEDLHCLNLLWGDCKPRNIIINEDEDVCLIDLGGSFSRQWVDQKNSDTLKGDEQGLANIVKYLLSG